MRIEPIDWNVVVLGFWNRAILTPVGIGRRQTPILEAKRVAELVMDKVIGAPVTNVAL